MNDIYISLCMLCLYIYIFFFSILLFLLLPFFTDFYRPYSVLRIEYDSHKDCITREKVKRECGEAGDPYFYRVYVEDLFLSSPHQLTALFGLSCRSYFFFFCSWQVQCCPSSRLNNKICGEGLPVRQQCRRHFFRLPFFQGWYGSRLISSPLSLQRVLLTLLLSCPSSLVMGAFLRCCEDSVSCLQYEVLFLAITTTAPLCP